MNATPNFVTDGQKKIIGRRQLMIGHLTIITLPVMLFVGLPVGGRDSAHCFNPRCSLALP